MWQCHSSACTTWQCKHSTRFIIEVTKKVVQGYNRTPHSLVGLVLSVVCVKLLTSTAHVVFMCRHPLSLGTGYVCGGRDGAQRVEGDKRVKDGEGTVLCDPRSSRVLLLGRLWLRCHRSHLNLRTIEESDKSLLGVNLRELDGVFYKFLPTLYT